MRGDFACRCEYCTLKSTCGYFMDKCVDKYLKHLMEGNGTDET